MADYSELIEMMEEGEEEECVALVKGYLERGDAPQQIINDGLMRGMEVIGVKFKAEEMLFAEVMLSAQCMHDSMDVLRPLLEVGEGESAGTFLIGTVAEDIHDIGKNLVSMNLRGAGFEVVDVGTEVSPDRFVDAVKEHEPDIVGLSALLTNTMPHMRSTIEAIDAAGLRENGKLKIIVGGAPVDAEFAREIGADEYGNDAIEAVTLTRRILEEAR
jgi:methylmalonyl-CoA mutase cobalamin-binding domain/chain